MRLFKIDNEVPDFAEWDVVYVLPESIAEVMEDATSPGLGSHCLRVRTATGSPVSLGRIGIWGIQGLAAGQTFCVGFWLRVTAPPVGGTSTLMVLYDAINLGGIRLTPSGQLQMQYLHEGPFDRYGTPVNLPSQWCYVVLEMRRCTGPGAADGWYRLFINGALADAAENISNSGQLASNPALYVGCPYGQYSGMDVCFDDVTASLDEYPEPYAPPPTDEHPQARRTVVLYRAASANSHALAEYCVTQLAVPRAHLCPLPNASGDEALADYASFQVQVENDLLAWLDRNPIIASRTTTFLLGYELPGTFAHDEGIYSATSRLMRLGQAFSPQAGNPLHSPTTVQRLTVSGLRAAGVYLAARIDAEDLATAQIILDAGSSSLGLSASDLLYSDDAQYRSSLARQRLRLPAADIGELAADALVFGDTSAATFGVGGSRAVLADGAAGSAASLRTGDNAGRRALMAGYAAVVGSTGAAESFDPVSFFEMLRIGGTLGEALAVAAAHLDYTAVAVGCPLLAATFPLGGHNIYHGLGGAEAIDWSDPVACMGPNQTSVEVELDLAGGNWHVLAARAVSAAGVEEGGATAVAFAAADESETLLRLLPIPIDVTGEVLSDGNMRIAFSCHVDPGLAEPTEFDVLTDHGLGGPLDTETPLASLPARARTSEYELNVTPASLPVRLAVRARDEDQLGPISNVVRVAAVSQPAPPITL